MAYLCGFLSKSLNLTAACLCKFYCVFEGVPIANLLSNDSNYSGGNNYNYDSGNSSSGSSSSNGNWTTKHENENGSTYFDDEGNAWDDEGHTWNYKDLW